VIFSVADNGETSVEHEKPMEHTKKGVVSCRMIDGSVVADVL